MATIQNIEEVDMPESRLRHDVDAGGEEGLLYDEKHTTEFVEKGSERDVKVDIDQDGDEHDQVHDADAGHPFPVEPGYVEETHQLTVRAVLVGCVLGAVVGASNIYLGLKTGFTFGPQLFGAIFGFAILKAISTAFAESSLMGRLVGGRFGPKENCTVQSAATAAGGLGIIFVGAIPAMYQLELLSASPKDDIGRLIAITACAGFFGIFFVIPLRSYYIVRQKLVFPTPSATAYTIRALHNTITGAEAAKKKSKSLLWTLISSFVFKVVNGYAPGVLLDWHIGWTMYRLGFTSMIRLENWGWILEFTPAFFGAGMLSGINASWSFLGGSVLAYGIIGPSIVSTGLAVGKPASEDYPLVSYFSLTFKDPAVFINTPSPRYWLLWPGVLIMLVYSFADVLLTLGPVLIASFRKGNGVSGWFRKNNDSDSSTTVEVNPDADQTPKEDLVPMTWWVGGLLASIVVCVSVLSTTFKMNAGEAILSLVLAFAFSFIGAQASGYTDTNPVTTIAKASQLVFGGISKGSGYIGNDALLLNLNAGVVAAGAAAQSVDMTGDLKTGYLLRAKPRNQFIAQLCGAIVSIFLCSGLFLLFATASPCIIDSSLSDHCTYAAPSIAAWAAVAVAVISPQLPISRSSGLTAIGLAIASVLTACIKHWFVPKKHWGWVPNWNAIGLAFVVPQIQYSIAMAIGSLGGWFWLKKSPASFEMYLFPVAAGLLAGEGLGGVFQALLAVAGVDGSIYGTAVGCPDFSYCG